MTTPKSETPSSNEPPTFASLPSTFFHKLTKVLIADNDTQSLARLNVTCKALKNETDAALWRKVVFGGKYDWSSRFSVGGYPGRIIEKQPFDRMKKLVREIRITDTTSVNRPARWNTWDLLSSFETLESLDYTFTHGSQAQDLCLWPRFNVTFPKL